MVIKPASGRYQTLAGAPDDSAQKKLCVSRRSGPRRTAFTRGTSEARIVDNRHQAVCSELERSGSTDLKLPGLFGNAMRTVTCRRDATVAFGSGWPRLGRPRFEL